MNKSTGILLGIVAVVLIVAVIFGSMWVGAYNGAITKSNEINQKQTQIYTAYSNRYEKIAAYIDAIDNADAQILAQMTLITDARTAFANAIAAGQLDVAEDASSTIESTFINLVSYMEDNPGWTTIGLTSGFMAEFAASTNAVTFAINSYNASLTDYNTFIALFPNNLFTGGFSRNDDFYTAPNFNTELPTFN